MRWESGLYLPFQQRQLLAQGIAMPELNFCVVTESNQNSLDSISQHLALELLRQ